MTKGMVSYVAGAFCSELEKIGGKSMAYWKARRRRLKRGKEYFAKRKRIPLAKDDRATLRARLAQAGQQPGSVSLARVDAGYAVHTHRARTKFYPTVEAIPLKKLRFISSTG